MPLVQYYEQDRKARDRFLRDILIIYYQTFPSELKKRQEQQAQEAA